MARTVEAAQVSLPVDDLDSLIYHPASSAGVECDSSMSGGDLIDLQGG